MGKYFSNEGALWPQGPRGPNLRTRSLSAAAVVNSALATPGHQNNNLSCETNRGSDLPYRPSLRNDSLTWGNVTHVPRELNLRALPVLRETPDGLSLFNTSVSQYMTP